MPGTESLIQQFPWILLELAVLLIAAILGHWGARLAHQPSVVGELLAGVLIGNLGLALGAPLAVAVVRFPEAAPLFTQMVVAGGSVEAAAQQVFPAHELAAGGAGAELIAALRGPHAVTAFALGFALWMFAQVGVVLLLFKAGLESHVGALWQTGAAAARVALAGILLPIGLTFGVTVLLWRGATVLESGFVAIALCATSVGISVRVLDELGKLTSREAHVLLGAAILDDVIGLLLQAVVIGAAVHGALALGDSLRVLGVGALFLFVCLRYGPRAVAWMVPLVRRVDPGHAKLLLPFALAFLLAWLSDLLGLAAILGAFVAGLLLTERQFRGFAEREPLTKLVHPIESLFAPLFFVLLGMQVRLSALWSPSVVLFTLALLVAAAAGKLIAGLLAGRGMNRLAVGFGMIPRGEVTLVVAGIGRTAGVLGTQTFSAIVLVVLGCAILGAGGIRHAFGAAARPRSQPGTA